MHLQAGIRVLQRELTGSLLASILALALDVAVFALLLRLFDWPWFLAAPVAYCSGAVIAYAVSTKVFVHRRFRDHSMLEFAFFLLIGISGLIVTQLVLWCGLSVFNGPPELVKLVAAGIAFAVNFGFRKVFLFCA